MPIFELSVAPVRHPVGIIALPDLSISHRNMLAKKPDLQQDLRHHPELRRFRYRPRDGHIRTLSIPVPASIPRTKRNLPVADRKTASIGNTNVIRTATDILFEKAYADFLNASPATARLALAQADHALYGNWREVQSVDELHWIPDGNAATAPRDLARAATAFKLFMAQDADYSFGLALPAAIPFIQSPILSILDKDFLNTLYLDVLRRGLHWIDLKQVRDKDLSPTQILQTVMRHRLAAPATQQELSVRMQQQRDIVVDEAALIFLYARGSVDEVPGDMMVAQARKWFGREMIEEWQDAAIGQVLMPSSPIAPAHAKFWFDGQVMQGTRGMSLDQIVDSISAAMPEGSSYPMEQGFMKILLDNAAHARHLPGQPLQLLTIPQTRALAVTIGADQNTGACYAYAEGAMLVGDAWLSRDQLHLIVWQAMRQLKLDSDYPGGTALNAIATIGLRLGPLHGITFGALRRKEELIPTYNRLLQAWHDKPHYSLSPALCAAFHLSRASGAQLLLRSANDADELQIRQRVLAQVLPALKAAGGTIASDIRHWNDFIDSLFFPSAAHALAPRKPAYASIEAGIVALTHALRHPFEIIRYTNGVDLAKQLLDYLHQRLIALKALPVVDSDLLRRQILRRQFDMSGSAFHTQRNVIYKSTKPYSRMTLHRQTPSTEFLFRCKHDYSKKMEFNGREIDVARQLQISRDAVARKLAHQDVVVAKAAEVLRQRSRSKDSPNTNQIATDIADAIATDKNNTAAEGKLDQFYHIFVDFGVTFPARIARMAPFAVPAWNIEEGIRLGDHPRAYRGAIDLGTDALILMLGAGAESVLSRYTVSNPVVLQTAIDQHTGTGILPEIAEQPQETVQLDLLAQQTFAERDPYGVHAIAETEFGSQPDTHLAGQHYPSVLLENEGRRVSVRNTATGPVEIDLHGNPIIDAPPILCSGQNTFYAMLQELGLPGGIAGIDSADLQARPTVKSVSAYWNGAMQIPSVRVRHDDVKAVISALFADAAQADHQSFHDFWRSTYARSETAAAIINARYAELLHTGRKASLEFGAERACRIGNRICFLSDDALRDNFYLSSGGPVVFQKKRMWLHESIHWLTNLKDMPDDMLYLGRGPTVYLTDRVLSEIGELPLIAPRIAYKPPSDLPMASHDAVHPYQWGKAVLQLNEWTIAENVVLDRLLDIGASGSATSQVVLGLPVTRRRTVQQGVELLVHLQSLGTLGAGNRLHIYEWLVDVFDTSAINRSYRPLLKDLVMQSETFRTLAAAWSLEFHPSYISVETGNFDRYMLADGFRSRLSHRITAGGSNVLLNNQELYFFSEKDLVGLGYERQYVGAMVELFLRDLLPELLPRRTSAAATNRGIGVLLENTIMRQIDASSVDRICDMLTSSPHALLTDQTTITRAAKTEDAYLRHLIYKNTGVDNIDASLIEPASEFRPVDPLGLWPAALLQA